MKPAVVTSDHRGDVEERQQKIAAATPVVGNIDTYDAKYDAKKDNAKKDGVDETVVDRAPSGTRHAISVLVLAPLFQ